MNFKSHYNLADKHAFLSPSSHHWINYDNDKLDDRYFTARAAARGTRIHEVAAECIELGIKLEHNNSTVSLYTNDAIDMGLSPEVVLYYSDNCFGTADAIGFDGSHLQIHDLKTGVSPVSVNQLMIYAALFCLEYNIKPFDITIELRIYQMDEVQIYDDVSSNDILRIMDKIIQMDKRIELLKSQV